MALEDERQHAMSLIGQLERRIDRHEDKLQALETIPGLLAAIDKRLEGITRRLDDGDREMRELRTGLATNTAVTTDVRDAQIAGRVITDAVKWLAMFLAAIGVIWAFVANFFHFPPGAGK